MGIVRPHPRDTKGRSIYIWENKNFVFLVRRKSGLVCSTDQPTPVCVCLAMDWEWAEFRGFFGVWVKTIATNSFRVVCQPPSNAEIFTQNAAAADVAAVVRPASNCGSTGWFSGSFWESHSTGPVLADPALAELQKKKIIRYRHSISKHNRISIKSSKSKDTNSRVHISKWKFKVAWYRTTHIMVTLMPYNYTAPRCGLIDKMIEPKVMKIMKKKIIRVSSL